MENKEVEGRSLREGTIDERSFDELAKELAEGTTSRGQVLKWLMGTILGGGLLALIPGVAGAQQRVGGGGGHHHHRHHGGGAGGGGGGVCPPTCPPGTIQTAAPTSQGECRCAALSPGLLKPESVCGGRVLDNQACCVCAFTVEGEGFCANKCDTIPSGLLMECTSSGDCTSGWKCIYMNSFIGDTGGVAHGICWPECHTTF